MNRTLLSRASLRAFVIGESVMRMWSCYVTAWLSVLSSVYGVRSGMLSVVFASVIEPLCLRVEITGNGGACAQF